MALIQKNTCSNVCSIVLLTLTIHLTCQNTILINCSRSFNSFLSYKSAKALQDKYLLHTGDMDLDKVKSSEFVTNVCVEICLSFEKYQLHKHLISQNIKLGI